VHAQLTADTVGEQLRWYVVRVAPQSEFKAAQALKRRGLSAFVPIEIKHVRRKPRSPVVKRSFPLFVRYVFAGARDIAKQWGAVSQDEHLYPRMIQGVLGLNQQRVLCLAPAEVSYLASLSDETIPYVQSVNPHKGTLAVKPGDKAEVIDGPLIGRTGKVCRVIGRKAMLELFDGLRTVEISVASLEAIG
jgi:transcription antitermination factor NusG